jgi:hypothetical protein
MKIRIKGNILRLRISKSELDRFHATGLLQETTDFGSSTLTYELRKDANKTNLEAGFSHNTISVWMPQSWVNEWIETERVGFANKTRPDDSLYILVEKDFKCLDETHEDQSDNFDNPLLVAKNEQKK